jgi:hypothetical protein
MKSIVMFDITGYECGELKTYKSFDILNIEPIEDNRFDPHEYNIEEFTNFKNISNNFSCIDDFDMTFSTSLNDNKSFKIIKNLYEEPQNLKYITDCDNLIIQTTGFNHQGLKLLIESFKKLQYVPKRVFFVLEKIYINEPMFEDVKFYKFLTPKRIIKL